MAHHPSDFLFVFSKLLLVTYFLQSDFYFFYYCFHLESFLNVQSSRRYIYGYYCCYYYTNIIGCMIALGRLVADACSTCVCDRNIQVCMKLLDLHNQNVCTTDWKEIVAMRCVTCTTNTTKHRNCRRLGDAEFTIHKICNCPFPFFFARFLFADTEMEKLLFHFYCSIMWLKFYWKIPFRWHLSRFFRLNFADVNGFATIASVAADNCPSEWIFETRHKKKMQFCICMRIVCAVRILLIRTSSP